MIVLVRKHCDDVGVRTVLMKILRQCGAPCVMEPVAEQQDSAPAHADLVEGRGHRLHAYNMVTNRRERPRTGFRQLGIG